MDPLDGPSFFPSTSNYTYDTSVYMNDSASSNGYPRVYTENTRDDDIKGCEPCGGYSSVYYNRYYAGEGNQCLGRSYPQCMRSDPQYSQLLTNQPVKYSEEQSRPIGYEVKAPVEEIPNPDQYVGSMKKEGFLDSGDTINGYDKKTILIILLAFVVVLLWNDNQKKARMLEFPYTYTFKRDGFSPFIYM